MGNKCRHNIKDRTQSSPHAYMTENINGDKIKNKDKSRYHR